jgi:2-octaprenyl-6-methoxyphenol hydroxylase
VLADLIAEYASDTGNPELLEKYESQRGGDVKTTVRYTDSLVRLFSNDNFMLGHARAGGLMAVDRISPLRNWVTRQSMGINYRQSRLARGLGLEVNEGHV